jgi:SAM-dependent methyltransferase
MNHSKGGYSRTGVYLEVGSAEPKHMFVCVADMVAERFNGGFRLLDVGSANGAFISYAIRRFPQLRATGIDFDPILVEEARRRVPSADFQVGDANQIEGLGEQAFEAVTMTGTHSIFEDFRPSFGECIRRASAGGRVVITGIFNPHPVDAQIHWRYPNRPDDAWHPGYNLFSHASVGAYLDAHPRVDAFNFHPFTVPFDIEPKADPIRSWTEANRAGGRMFRNGIMPLNFEMLVVDIRKT